MLDCGECSECCSGALEGNAHGNEFYPGRACVFLCKGKCATYINRPETCRTFQCGWSQELFEIERPDISRIIVSIEIASNKQFLKCVAIGQYSEFDRDYLEHWAVSHNTYCVWIHNIGNNNENQYRWRSKEV